jgi:hypothetical protein
LFRKFRFHENLTRITDTEHEVLYTFIIICRSVLFKMMFQTKFVEKIKTHILCSTTFFRKSYVHEIMLKNTVQPGKPQPTVWSLRIIHWITKDTNKY